MYQFAWLLFKTYKYYKYFFFIYRKQTKNVINVILKYSAQKRKKNVCSWTILRKLSLKDHLILQIQHYLTDSLNPQPVNSTPQPPNTKNKIINKKNKEITSCTVV